MVEISGRLADYIKNTKYQDLSKEIVAVTKKSILDILGVTIAGSCGRTSDILTEQVKEWGGAEQCSVLAYGIKLPAPWAAMVNGALSRTLDFDDVIDKLGIHPSVAIFPALLAIAELKKNVSGEQFIVAMAIGHDLCIRLADARQMTLLETGRYDLSKVIAAAAAAGKLYGLNREELINAMGIAYTTALGEAQCMVDGSMSVHYQQGMVAFNAVMAVLLAKRGLTGAHNIFCGRYGYYNAFEPNSNVNKVLECLGQEFAGLSISYKPYPTCRPNISGICLIIEMMKKYQFDHHNIEEIVVHTNQQIYDLVCAPVNQKKHPISVVDARFSLAYNIAVAVLKGTVFIDDFTEEAIKRTDVLEISAKVFPVVDEVCDNSEQYGCLGSMNIDIKMKDGTCLSDSIVYPKGHPSNTMTYEDVKYKFEQCVRHSRKQKLISNSQYIVDSIQSIEKIECINSLLNCIAEV